MQAFFSLVLMSPELVFDVPFVGEMDPLAPGEAYTTVSMDAMRAYVAAPAAQHRTEGRRTMAQRLRQRE